jgi:hypothetical protein
MRRRGACTRRADPEGGAGFIDHPQWGGGRPRVSKERLLRPVIRVSVFQYFLKQQI